jgi:hypothetical protein
MSNKIYWPCILTLEGDDELVYLDSKQDFIAKCSELILADADGIIDSMGVHYLIKLSKNELTLVNTDRIWLINEVSDLIRAHEFNKAELCLTKIHFNSITNAIESLTYKNNT